ncbi:MAG: phosphotransferase [Planctomycetota bacterium]|nr:phosphotransferase [Planctomycetota bacterium]
MVTVRIQEEMKRDALGAVHRVVLEREDEPVTELVLRSIDGWLVCRPFARALARREQRALAACHSAAPDRFVPPPLLGELERAVLGRVPGVQRGDLFLRPYFSGTPLHRAERLPLDFFDLLEAAVRDLHSVGVCHNDLHKEQNVVVEVSGRPRLIDFQLASVHASRRGGRFESRCRDDLRHVQKLRRRYTKDGRGPAAIGVPESARMRRRGLALLWRRTGKPLYLFLTRGLLGTKDGEERRASDGDWPSWGDPVGAEPGRGGAGASATDRSARRSS